LAAVVVGNVVGLCGNIAAAVVAKQAGDLNIAAAAASARNDTDSYSQFIIQQGDLKSGTLSEVTSVQQFCEVAVLLIIILAFAVVGISSARRVSSALRDMNDEHGAAGRQLRRQIVGTAAVVFLTFLLRAVFSIMNAVSDALQDYGAACAAAQYLHPCDPLCFNTYTLMQNWLEYAPEFQLIIELISSPLTLLVALWGMTSKRMLQTMKWSRRQMTATGGSLLCTNR